jgi:hypothetical protein
MPRFDGTGPDSRGPGTGRGMGLCARARRCSDVKELSKEEEKVFLQKRKESLQKELQEIEKRLN